jgi:hypothetical protein
MIFFLGLGGIAVIAGGLGTWYFGTGHEVHTLRQGILLAGIPFAFLVIGLYLILVALRSKVVLCEDRIEIHELTRVRAVKRDELAGWRLNTHTTPPLIILVPKRPNARTIRLAKIFNVDSVFLDWMDSLKDLDTEDSRKSYQEIADDADIGCTPDQRIEALEDGRRLAKWLSRLALAACAWGMFYPRPYNLMVAVLACLPWLAVTMPRRSKGVFRIDEYKNDAHPSVALLFLLPGMVLCLRAVLDIQIAGWKESALLASVVGLSLWAVALWSDRSMKKKKSTSIVMVFFSLGYGYGAGIEANVLLDRSLPTTYRSTVITKHISSGKYTDYKFQLAPTGPNQSISDVSVARDLYHSKNPGDPVCIDVRKGALRVNWYTVESCTP